MSVTVRYAGGPGGGRHAQHPAGVVGVRPRVRHDAHEPGHPQPRVFAAGGPLSGGLQRGALLLRADGERQDPHHVRQRPRQEGDHLPH
eukprot:4830027-Pyramimonas_sp.AAC.1